MRAPDIRHPQAPGPGHRRPTKTEAAARTDFALMDARWRTAVGQATARWSAVVAHQRSQLREQVASAVDSNRLDRLADLHVDTESGAEMLAGEMEQFALAAGKQMQREAEDQGVRVPEWSLEDDALVAGASSVISRIGSFARVTARSLATRLTSMVSRSAVVAAQSSDNGNTVAAAADAPLADAAVRSEVAAAMTAAQNMGRVAVLAVAPAAAYYAAESLDKNTCSPCSGIDGTLFASLREAQAAYPAGGYINCQGGGRCRGTMISVWQSAETAGARPEGESIMTTETEDIALGGKPNQGTKKDKRLKPNKYTHDSDCLDCETDPEHFGSASGSVSGAPWNGSASRFTDDQYRMATAACDPGDGSVKERCFLPHHEPGGATSKAGVHAAAARFNQLSGHDPAAVAKAKAHLRSHYAQLGETPPDVLKATDEETEAMAKKPDCPPGMEPDPDTGKCVKIAASAKKQECPPGMEPDPKTGKCMEMMSSTSDVLDIPEDQTASWEGVLVVEGEVTGDGREFGTDALTWPDPIEPGEVLLRWNKEDSHGGDPRTVAVAVGRIDRIWKDGNKIMGSGVFDLGHPDGVEAHRRVQEKFLRGVSLDADSVAQADVELVWPESDDNGSEDGDIFDQLFGSPEKVIYHGGRIRAATLCDIPAFIEAYIALTDSEGAVVAAGQTYPELVKARSAPAAPVMDALASSSWRPASSWFDNPRFSQYSPIVVTDEGRVYGHAAPWGTCHIGMDGVCVTPPEENDHGYFMTGEVVCSDGVRVSVGQITVHTVHAPLSMGAAPAVEHYEHTGSAVADVAVGNDAHGIWVAGSVRPDVDPALVYELRASGEVSGDWRRIGGQLRLVGLLGVNIPGFPVPKTASRVASGVQMSLVAAGRPATSRALSREQAEQYALKTVMDMLFRQIHEGTGQ